MASMFAKINPLFFTVGILLPLACIGCVHFELANGSTLNNYFPVKDKTIIDSATLAKNQIDIDLFNQPDTTSRIQFVSPADIKKLVKSSRQPLLIILYQPTCREIDYQMVLPKYAETVKINYMLLSAVYSPGIMKSINFTYNLKNKNQYIIPTVSASKSGVLQKRIDFQRALDPNLYQRFKDDLLFTQLIIIYDDTVEINPGNTNGPTDNDFLIGWINEKFHL